MDKPCYCRQCDSQNSWVLSPKNDILFESGKVFQAAYKCKVCGSVCRYPVSPTSPDVIPCNVHTDIWADNVNAPEDIFAK